MFPDRAPGVRLACCCAVLLLGVSPAAQIDVEVRTVTRLTARTPAGAQSIPAGTVMDDGEGVTSTETVGTCTATARAFVSFSSSTTIADASFRSSASTTESFSQCSSGPAAVDGNAILVSLTSPVPVSGQVLVVVSGRGSSSLNWAQSEFAIDVGDDASPELSGTTVYGVHTLAGFVERPAVLGPTPLRIRLDATVVAQRPYLFGTSGYVDLTVSFRPGPGRLGTTGSACGAALVGTLASDHTGQRLRMDATTTARASATLLALGTLDLAVALPPTGCLLRTDPSTVVPIAMVNGAWSITLPLPTPLPVLDLRAQVLAVASINNVDHWSTSESLRIRLP